SRGTSAASGAEEGIRTLDVNLGNVISGSGFQMVRELESARRCGSERVGGVKWRGAITRGCAIRMEAFCVVDELIECVRDLHQPQAASLQALSLNHRRQRLCDPDGRSVSFVPCDFPSAYGLRCCV